MSENIIMLLYVMIFVFILLISFLVIAFIFSIIVCGLKLIIALKDFIVKKIFKK